MFKKGLLLLLALFITTPAFCNTIGSVDYMKVLQNYAKAKTAYEEIDDRASELQRYLMDKEKEFKKIESPVQRKAFEEKTAKEFAVKQEAFTKFKAQKEESVDKEVQNAVKAVALENKLDVVLDEQAVLYGGVDVTQKIIQKLNIVKQ